MCDLQEEKKHGGLPCRVVVSADGQGRGQSALDYVQRKAELQEGAVPNRRCEQRQEGVVVRELGLDLEDPGRRALSPPPQDAEQSRRGLRRPLCWPNSR